MSDTSSHSSNTPTSDTNSGPVSSAGTPSEILVPPFAPHAVPLRFDLPAGGDIMQLFTGIILPFLPQPLDPLSQFVAGLTAPNQALGNDEFEDVFRLFREMIINATVIHSRR